MLGDWLQREFEGNDGILLLPNFSSVYIAVYSFQKSSNSILAMNSFILCELYFNKVYTKKHKYVKKASQFIYVLANLGAKL